jgi:hypothetical protein
LISSVVTAERTGTRSLPEWPFRLLGLGLFALLLSVNLPTPRVFG